jgi:FkbM family methyltransferase
LVNPKYFNLRWWLEALVPRARILRASFGFKPRVAEKCVEGVPFKFFISSPSAAVWYGEGRGGDDIEMRFVRDHLVRPGRRVIEIGSHHGFTTLMLANWVGSTGQVYACEPVPGNIAVLRQNLTLNRIRNVTIAPVALGPRAGKVSFFDETNGSVKTGRAGKPAIEVEMMTLDEFCQARGFWPDLIKMDVEGFELDILSGAARVLQQRPALHIEIHPHQIRNYGKTAADIWGLIDQEAYELFYQPHDHSEVRKIGGPVNIVDRSHLYCIPRLTV